MNEHSQEQDKMKKRYRLKQKVIEYILLFTGVLGMLFAIDETPNQIKFNIIGIVMVILSVGIYNYLNQK